MPFPVLFGIPGDGMSYIERAGEKIAYWIRNWAITPNQITVFRLSLTPLVYCFLAQAEYLYFVFSAILIEFLLLLDTIDGSLARLKNMESELGIWLEKNFDYLLSENFSLLGFFISLAVYKIEQHWLIWGVLFFNVFGHLANRVFSEAFSNLVKDAKDESRQRAIVGRGLFRKVWIFIQWYSQFVVLCLLLYGPVYSYTGINLLLYSMVFIMLIRNLQWINQVIKTLKYFYRSAQIIKGN